MPQLLMQTPLSVCCAVSKSRLNFLLSQKGKKKQGDNQSNQVSAQILSLSDVKIINRQKNVSVVIESPSVSVKIMSLATCQSDHTHCFRHHVTDSESHMAPSRQPHKVAAQLGTPWKPHLEVSYQSRQTRTTGDLKYLVFLSLFLKT